MFEPVPGAPVSREPVAGMTVTGTVAVIPGPEALGGKSNRMGLKAGFCAMVGEGILVFLSNILGEYAGYETEPRHGRWQLYR